jgi:hypothetical protein
MTKKLIYVIALISLAAISCGVAAQLPTQPTAPVPHVTAPVPVVSANAESVNKNIHNYITTAPLHVRSCAGVDCGVLAYLPAQTSVIVTVRGITGGGCAGAEWYKVEAGGVAGFVCSIYIKER